MFTEHLDRIDHKHIQEITFAEHVRAEMKWRTTDNVTDCGVFLMLHMESYMGEEIQKWNCGLSHTKHIQSKQLANLRRKFATKLILSDINMIKTHFLDLVNDFFKKPEHERIKIIKHAFDHRMERDIFKD